MAQTDLQCKQQPAPLDVPIAGTVRWQARSNNNFQHLVRCSLPTRPVQIPSLESYSATAAQEGEQAHYTQASCISNPGHAQQWLLDICYLERDLLGFHTAKRQHDTLAFSQVWGPCPIGNFIAQSNFRLSGWSDWKHRA